MFKVKQKASSNPVLSHVTQGKNIILWLDCLSYNIVIDKIRITYSLLFAVGPVSLVEL